MTPTALVTGASRGLGRTLAEFLAPQGYRLVLTARGGADLAHVAEGCARHTDVIALPGDVADPDHRAALADAVGERLDLLVNNASTLGPTPRPRLVDAEPRAFLTAFDINVVAPMALAAATLPALQAARGLVVNVSSDAAVGAYAGWGIYGASKSALELASATLAKELEQVTVVTVDPGDMRTDMQQAAFPGDDIGDRPLPEATLPFWAWLLGAPRAELDGRKFRAQDETWTTPVDAPDMWVA